MDDSDADVTLCLLRLNINTKESASGHEHYTLVGLILSSDSCQLCLLLWQEIVFIAGLCESEKRELDHLGMNIDLQSIHIWDLGNRERILSV